MELVGRGERVAVSILKDIYPDAEITTQVPLYKLLLPRWREGLSERQQKETIDIVVKRKHEKVLCIRVNDKRHFTKKFTQIDNVQRRLLEWSYNRVVDLDEYECPHLFKDENNEKSRAEIEYYL